MLEALIGVWYALQLRRKHDVIDSESITMIVDEIGSGLHERTCCGNIFVNIRNLAICCITNQPQR